MNQYRGHPVVGNEESVKPGLTGTPDGIAAKYEGFCRKCKEPIHVGQIIVKKGDGKYEHSTCVPASDPARTTEPSPVRPLFDATGAFMPPAGLPNGVWTIQGPRGHRTYRISTVLKPGEPQAPEYSPATQGDPSFRAKHAGKRMLELLTGPDNTKSYKGLAWYEGRIGHLWKFGKDNEVLVNTFAKLVEREEHVDGYEVHFARHCYKCNRLLTTPESIQRGIGPVCAQGGFDG